MWAPLALLALPLGIHVAAHAVGTSVEELATGTAHLSAGDSSLVALLTAAPVVLSYFAGALLSGALVGRFGGKSGPREGALGGVTGAIFVSLLGFRPGLGLSLAGIFAVFTMLSLLGATGGAIGAVWGTRSRR
jgi:hypothetical protein